MKHLEILKPVCFVVTKTGFGCKQFRLSIVLQFRKVFDLLLLTDEKIFPFIKTLLF